GVRELAYQAPDLRRSEALRAVYVIGERFPLCPLQREVMQTVGLAVFVGAHHARMPDARAVAGLPQEAFHRRGVAPQTLSQYLERAGAALRVLGPVDFGRASLADATPDSTLAVFALSLANHALSFQRDGNVFVAQYHVEVAFRADTAPARQIASDETVRIRTFQETLRADESVIFQQFVGLRP